MFGFGLTVGVLGAGALMYYIQPQVKDAVAKAFLGAPALIAQAEALKARADAIISAAKDVERSK